MIWLYGESPVVYTSVETVQMKYVFCARLAHIRYNHNNSQYKLTVYFFVVVLGFFFLFFFFFLGCVCVVWLCCYLFGLYIFCMGCSCCCCCFLLLRGLLLLFVCLFVVVGLLLGFLGGGGGSGFFAPSV